MRVLLSLLISSLATLPGLAGTITGTVPLPKSKAAAIPMGKYRGKISGKVAKPSALIAAIWLEGPALKAPAKPKPAILSQKNYQFAKSLLVISTGTTVFFPNNDPDYHNIYSLSKSKKFDLGRYKSGENPAPNILFDKPGFIELRCEIHEHMNANIIVVDSPHFITSDAKGNFKLKNIPPGTYTLHAQIDRKTSWKIPVQVLADKSTTIQFPER